LPFQPIHLLWCAYATLLWRRSSARARFDLGMPSVGDFNTLAGFVLRRFDRIPAVGERIDWRGRSFEVSDMARAAR